MPRSQFSSVARGIWYLAANLACDSPVRARICLTVILLDLVVALVDDLDVVEEVVIVISLRAFRPTRGAVYYFLNSVNAYQKNRFLSSSTVVFSRSVETVI